jgi:hypothetical protein
MSKIIMLYELEALHDKNMMCIKDLQDQANTPLGWLTCRMQQL